MKVAFVLNPEDYLVHSMTDMTQEVSPYPS